MLVATLGIVRIAVSRSAMSYIAEMLGKSAMMVDRSPCHRLGRFENYQKTKKGVAQLLFSEKDFFKKFDENWRGEYGKGNAVITENFWGMKRRKEESIHE